MKAVYKAFEAFKEKVKNLCTEMKIKETESAFIGFCNPK